MNSIFKNKYFLGGLLIRFLLLPYASDGVMSDYFIKFIDTSISQFPNNPWSNLPPEYFPYGFSLFIVIFIPKYFGHIFLGEMATSLNHISYFLMKLPLFGADILFLAFLLKMIERRANHVLLFYWLNPIAIYITYVHGQLDILPMLYATVALYLVGKEKFTLSGIAMGLAVTGKFHVALLVPLILAYFWNNDFIGKSMRKITSWLLAFIPTVALLMLPIFISEKIAYNSLGSPEALRIFSLSFSYNNHTTLYFGVIIVLLILARFIFATKMNAESLVFSSGILFGSLLTVTSAMPGWYFWIIPTVALFYSTYNFAPRILYFLFITFYFLTFAVDLTALINIPQITGISFSILQLIVFTIMIFIYVMAVRHQVPLLRRLRPLTVGIAGNSGAGKNLISASLTSLFGRATTQVIEGDDYHKWERGNEKWQDYTHLHPRANHLSDLREHFKSLSKGRLIFQKHYDHSSGKFSEPRPLMPTKTIIVQGLHSLYLRSLRDHYDLKIFIAPAEDLRTAWKIKRDCGERGHTLEKVINSIRIREKDSSTYVDPQKEIADLIVEYIPKVELPPEKVLAMEKIDFSMNIILWNDNMFEDLITDLSKCKTLWISVKDQKDQNRIAVHIDGQITASEIQSIADQTIANQRAITRSRQEPIWENDYIGVIQLFIMKMLSTEE